ncbi:protein HOTHEAD-like [Prosopis cineraria]|uniref:protein HOTHEAD-like n=1 Tax=Prosopis cineraria TaxID=364024 RepID=UPI00240F13C6|nr:protein HOTHEAD-like [Prosopis cineraria]
MDAENKQLRNKIIQLVKVIWKETAPGAAICETENQMRKEYPLSHFISDIYPFLCNYIYAAPYFPFIKEATHAPAVSVYDYIVIGGGTCGCPLAATLSQRANVLVLERGGSPYIQPDKISLNNFVNSLIDTTPSSFAQQFVSTDGVLNAQAQALGGGSVINAGFYSWAEPVFVREVGWDERLVKESYEWVEKVVVFEPTVRQWQSAVRDGLKEVGVLPYNDFSFDHLVGIKVGGTIFYHMGHRHTAADLLTYANPLSISVYIHATVQKILFRHNLETRRPQAYGVIYKDEVGIIHRAYLKGMGEIILSAGATGSPQMLMLSGIGPANHLQAHRIKVVLDQPMVGQGMADNPMNVLIVPSPVPIEVSLIQTVGITKFGSYIETASGLNLGLSWPQRLQRIFELVSNQTSMHSLKSKNMNKWTTNIRSFANLSLAGGVILEKILGPLSTGHLELSTTNPNDNPLVTFNYFKEPEDLRACVEGMRTIIDVINSNTFSRFRYKNMPIQALFDLVLSSPMNLRPKHASAAFSLEQYCIDTVLTIWHYHGGCHVGKVVDRVYKVKGVDSLRVIDGSTFFGSPGTNPQATVMMLERYMRQQILWERFLHKG